MSNRLQPEIERARIKLRRTNTGWVSAGLPELGRFGRIHAVKLRCDATEDDGTAPVLYVARGAMSATPDDLDVFYQSAAIALSGSATAASLMDALPAPATYRVADLGDLQVAANITAGGSGATTLWVEILAEVWG